MNYPDIFCHIRLLEIEQKSTPLQSRLYFFPYIVIGTFVPKEGLVIKKKNPCMRQRVCHNSKNYNDCKSI